MGLRLLLRLFLLTLRFVFDKSTTDNGLIAIIPGSDVEVKRREKCPILSIEDLIFPLMSTSERTLMDDPQHDRQRSNYTCTEQV